MAIDIEVSRLKVYGDSELVINQLQSAYEVRKPDLLPYHSYACKLVGWFSSITLSHVPRKGNAKVDTLASALASLDKEINIRLCQAWVVPPVLREGDEVVNLISVYQIEYQDWRQHLIDYLEHGRLSSDP